MIFRIDNKNDLFLFQSQTRKKYIFLTALAHSMQRHGSSVPSTQQQRDYHRSYDY